jgi:hypothetical protein
VKRNHWTADERVTLEVETICALRRAIETNRVEIVIPPELCHESIMAFSIAAGYPMSAALREFIRSNLRAMPGLDELERARVLEITGFDQKEVGK